MLRVASWISFGGILFFFFKQKTAYELRISDWSSDVCSSDLAAIGRDRRALRALQRRGRQLQPVEHAALGGRLLALACRRRFRRWALRGRPEAVEHRSEEHTPELQSLMRISYAAFCLKKKNPPRRHTHKRQTSTTTTKTK